MPQAGVSTRARRRSATPWSDELDHDAFRFPTGYEAKRAERRVARTVAEGMAVPADRKATVAERPAPVPAVPAPVAAAPAPVAAPPAETPRRTVTIRGHGAERNLPVARPTLRRHERPGFKADRAALWAVMLGLVLILVAAASAHGAVLH